MLHLACASVTPPVCALAGSCCGRQLRPAQFTNRPAGSRTASGEAVRAQPLAGWHLVQRGRQAEHVDAGVTTITQQNLMLSVPTAADLTQQYINVAGYAQIPTAAASGNGNNSASSSISTTITTTTGGRSCGCGITAGLRWGMTWWLAAAARCACCCCGVVWALLPLLTAAAAPNVCWRLRDRVAMRRWRRLQQQQCAMQSDG